MDIVIIFIYIWIAGIVQRNRRALFEPGVTCQWRNEASFSQVTWQPHFKQCSGTLFQSTSVSKTRAGCSQSAVSKHVNRKLSGRKKCERKRCTTNRENRSLMRIVKQNRFKNLGELHKEWTEAGVKASRATTHRRVKEFGYSCRIPLVKPLLNHRQRQRRLTWAKEK